MMPVPGPIPECSTRKSFAASIISVTALYADVMAKSEPKDEAFEKLVEAALNVDPKGLSGKHKNEKPPKKPRSSKQ